MTDPSVYVPKADVSVYRADMTCYAREVLVIKTKAAQLVPFVFNRAQNLVQERLAEQLRETGRVRAIVLKARQEGVSTLVAGRNFRRINLYLNQTVLVIADAKKRGASLFGIYETFHRYLTEDMRPVKRYAQKATQLWYDTPSGVGGLDSKVIVETANDADVGRGSTIQAVHASEFAFWSHAEDVYVALMQAVPDDGTEVVIESTANGVGNAFHNMWVAACAGENGYIAIFLPWWIHEEYQIKLSPVGRDEIMFTLNAWEREAIEVGFEWEGEFHRLSPEQIAWRRQTIRDKLGGDERMFRQEYPSTAREAFLVSGNCFFDEDVLLRYERMTRAPMVRSNLTWVKDGIVAIRAPRGHLRQWFKPSQCEPDQEGECGYVIFGDTATGKQISGIERASDGAEAEKGGRDFSSAYVVCAIHRKFVANLHGRLTPEAFAEQIRMLGYLYSNPKVGFTSSRSPALIAVESNHSSGGTVLRLLKEDYRYPNMYYHRQINRRTNRRSQVLGWVTNQENRQVILDQFSQALREDAVAVQDEDLVRECFTFVRGSDGKPEAQDGCHDDRVISAAGAWQLALTFRRPSKVPLDPGAETADTPTGWAAYS